MKLATPTTFKGEYREVLSVLNWTHSVESYLTQCRVDMDDCMGYVRSYMSSTVQAWMDGQFPPQLGVVSWAELRAALIERYLPPDHEVRLKLRWEKTVQFTTLTDYVERIQVMDSALTFGGLQISDKDKVLQFIRGLRNDSDKMYLIQEDPRTLAECYALAHRIRQAKTLTSALHSGRGPRSMSPGAKRQNEINRLESKRDRVTRRLNLLQAEAGPSESHELNKLQGEAKKKAWDEGRCLECGQAGHMMRECPALKKHIKKITREAMKSYQVKKKKRLNKLDSQGEGEPEDASGLDDSEESSDSSESEGNSGNSDPEP